MNSIAQMAGRLLDDRQEFVLATIVSRQGSAPRTAGSRMIICRDGRPLGTIGGGLLEARVVQKTREVLSSKCPMVIPFDMTHSELASMDIICGGRLEVLLEFIDPGSPAAIVFKCWRDAEGTPEPSLFLTVLRSADEKVEGIDHGLLKNQRVVCGDLRLAPAIVEKLTRDYWGAACSCTLTLEIPMSSSSKRGCRGRFPSFLL